MRTIARPARTALYDAPVNAIVRDDDATWGPYLVASVAPAPSGRGMRLTLIDSEGDASTIDVGAYDDASADVVALDATPDDVDSFA
jgi:hypothetical protein